MLPCSGIPDIKELKPRLVVFGIGGAGGNAVNNMVQSGLSGVEFVAANTDAQALALSKADKLIQMGVEVTGGLGAGSQPEVGCAAAEEVVDEISSHLAGSHMVFVTAGMGGGTGTGAAPVIARVAKQHGVLTVGVVTKPFQFEGSRRMRVAMAGLTELHKYVDTLMIIPNQNLFRVATENTTFADAFAMADQVLYSGVACITDLMVKPGLINLDFADVRSIMQEMGKALMGTGEASGEKRALHAAEAAIANPLLDEISMRGARGVLISISGGKDLTLFELDEAATRIREEVDPDANIILGATFDDNLDGVIRVSVVATGVETETPAIDEEQVTEVPSTAKDQAVESVLSTLGDLYTNEVHLSIASTNTEDNPVSDKLEFRSPRIDAAEHETSVLHVGNEDEDIRQLQVSETPRISDWKLSNEDLKLSSSSISCPPEHMSRLDEFPQMLHKQVRDSFSASSKPQEKKSWWPFSFFRKLATKLRGSEQRVPSVDCNLDNVIKVRCANSTTSETINTPKNKVAFENNLVSVSNFDYKASSKKISREQEADRLEIPAFLRRR